MDKEIKDVENERGHFIDALVIRIMKHRKIMDYTSLIEEVIKLAILFKPHVILIKRSIEQLIEKEYLKREEENMYSFEWIY